MDIDERISSFSALGQKLRSLSPEQLEALTTGAYRNNPWFTPENVQRAVGCIGDWLTEGVLKEWVQRYPPPTEVPRIVGIVMAGNIPLVGFHDLLCVLMSGHFAAIKTSSKDQFLISRLMQWLTEIEPRWKRNFEIRERLTNIDAVIATGSDNTSRYFDFYFRELPRIIRKNRVSVAVLTGEETRDDLLRLGDDIFLYFGLGCRNVSKIFVPVGYEPKGLFEALEPHHALINNHKYCNNYEYYKSIFLINRTPHLDTGFLLWLPSDELVSPISVLYSQEYKDLDAARNFLKLHEKKIQCVVGNGYIPFGQAQRPHLYDYADHIDTMEFLSQL